VLDSVESDGRQLSELTWTEIGTAGEHLFCARVILTGGGDLELYRPVSDEDHTDVVAGRKGRAPNLAIQVKTCRDVDKNGLLEAATTFQAGEPRDDPALVYAVLYVPELDIDRAWLIPSHAFNSLAYRTVKKDGRLALNLRIHLNHADAANPYEVDTADLGPRLMSFVGASRPSPHDPPPSGSVFLFLNPSPAPY
jgi:hypothetical protein